MPGYLSYSSRNCDLSDIGDSNLRSGDMDTDYNSDVFIMTPGSCSGQSSSSSSSSYIGIKLHRWSHCDWCGMFQNVPTLPSLEPDCPMVWWGGRGEHQTWRSVRDCASERLSSCAEHSHSTLVSAATTPATTARWLTETTETWTTETLIRTAETGTSLREPGEKTSNKNWWSKVMAVNSSILSVY